MKYRYLGSSGLLMSRLTLGTMTFGAPDWGCDEKASHHIIRRYLDAGGNCLDIADIYAGGRSEEIVGTLMPELNRDGLIIASKCALPSGPAVTQVGANRKQIIASCEKSLKRLKTDYIDLYHIHVPDPVTPVEETMRAMDDLVRQGKVRYTGSSMFFGWQLTKAQGMAGAQHLEKMVAGQYIYSLIHRELERETIPAAIDAGIGITCFSPLGGGLLTGKYRGQEKPEKGTRASFRTHVDGPRFWHPRGYRTADIVADVSKRSGIASEKLAIAWPLGRKFVTSVIIGVRTADQLEANMAPADWDLPQEVWRELEERTRPEEEYMTWYQQFNHRRFFAASEFHEGKADAI
ncbi:MAG: aldo/keto reductase [Desulfobacteraceae bacterium]|jgi:aryl-alcohol dehydrogenase-like predicted oxidoreductase|nr:aldo/keto reductase [Desulfobacteraceae bacterium]